MDMGRVVDFSLGFLYNFFVGRYKDFFLSNTDAYCVFFYPTVNVVIVLLNVMGFVG